jgi:hypothetical protein
MAVSKARVVRMVLGILLAMIIVSAAYEPFRLPLAIAVGTCVAALVTAANLSKDRGRNRQPAEDGETWPNRFTLDPP